MGKVQKAYFYSTSYLEGSIERGGGQKKFSWREVERGKVRKKKRDHPLRLSLGDRNGKTRKYNRENLGRSGTWREFPELQ